MKGYIKKTIQPMYPWFEGINMTGVSVWEGDVPELGGMIAVNLDDEKDKWYVAKAFFEANYMEAPSD